MTVSFVLRENPVISDTDLITLPEGFFQSWKHSILDWGGNWTGDGQAISRLPPGIEDGYLKNFFMSNLGRRIVVRSGGKDFWEGQIVEMEYTHLGQSSVRSLNNVANRNKVLYSKVGPQLFTNGDVETAAWTQVGSPSTFETTTAWFAKGTTAMHIVSTAAGDGAQIENSGAPAAITVTASKAYTVSAVVYVVSGTWTLNVYQSGTSTIIASRSTSGTGSEWLQCQIPDTNTVTSVVVRLICADASQECYADGGLFRASALRAETRWYEDASSIAALGRIEAIFLDEERTDSEAEARAAKELAQRAWPRTKPAARGSSEGNRAAQAPDSLTISCLGLVGTLEWRYTLIDSVDQASDHITNLLAESEFLTTSNMIDTNATEVIIESGNPITLWQAVKKVLDSGDGSTEWMAGCYPGAVFVYEARPTSLYYEARDGSIFNYGGGAIDPLSFRPGWCLMSYMPFEPTPPSGTDEDDPRRAWLKETWFVMDQNGIHVEWSREDDE